MTLSILKEREEELVSLLNRASNAYYNTGNEIMSNKEYDSLFDELKELEDETGVVLPDSPTHNVGAFVQDDNSSVSELPKERHEFLALSLGKTKDSSVFPEIFGVRDGFAVIMWKMDGSTLQLTYDNGILSKAITRGNGEVGQVVTHNAPFIKGIPTFISYQGHLVIRGEVIMTRSEFDRINNERSDFEEVYKNPRNLANATLTIHDSNEMKKRELCFYAFKLVHKEDSDKSETFDNQLDWMEEQGFSVVEHKKVKASTLVKEMESFSAGVNSLPYPVDGLVVAANDVAYAETLPSTGHHPDKLVGYAFKWADETAETKLVCIEWSASRTGLLNPVAVFDPVELEGTTVSRASLSNVSILKKLRLRVGDRITVFKANKIIPQVDENLDAGEELSYEESHPLRCPCCGEEASVHISKDGIELAVCENPNCSAKHIKKFVHFASRDCLDIAGFNDATIEKFVDRGFIKEYADFFKLDRYKDEIIKMDGFGKKSYQNLVESAEEAKATSFVPFVTSLGISGIGKGQCKLLNKEFSGDVIDFFRVAYNRGNLSMIDGIGGVLENNIWQWANEYLRWIPFSDDISSARETVHDVNWEIANLYELMKFVKEDKSGNSIFAGKTFVITGDLSYCKNRDELTSVIESMGGKVSSSVSSKTSYLINNDSESFSTKNKKAKALGIPIITEEYFVKVLKTS